MVFNTLTGKQKSSWCGCIDVKAFGPAGNVSALQKTFSKRFKAKNTHPSRYFYIHLSLYAILMCIYFPQAAHWAVWPQASPWLQAGWDTLAHTRVSCELCYSQVTQGVGAEPQWMEPLLLKMAKSEKCNSPAGFDAIFSSSVSSISEQDGGWASVGKGKSAFKSAQFPSGKLLILS